jgi:hypothetical protein
MRSSRSSEASVGHSRQPHQRVADGAGGAPGDQAGSAWGSTSVLLRLGTSPTGISATSCIAAASITDTALRWASEI